MFFLVCAARLSYSALLICTPRWQSALALLEQMLNEMLIWPVIPVVPGRVGSGGGTGVVDEVFLLCLPV